MSTGATRRHGGLIVSVIFRATAVRATSPRSPSLMQEGPSMSTGDRDFLYSAIDATLNGVVDLLPVKPGWFEPWRRLGPDSAEEERLAVYQAIRDSGVLPEEAGFYLVSWQVDAIARRLAESGLRHLDDRLKDIET